MQSHPPLPPGFTPPDALLLIASRCPHCQAVLETLTRLVKEGHLGRLTVINVSAAPQAPEALGLRSVPWTRIGSFELSGALSASELMEWVQAAGVGGGWGSYFTHLIEAGRLDTLVQRIQETPRTLTDLLDLFADPETPFAVRIGVSAVMEALAEGPILRRAVPQILTLTLDERPQVRADACYFLGLAGDPVAAPAVGRLLEDEDAEVRAVAVEALGLLGGATSGPGEISGP